MGQAVRCTSTHGFQPHNHPISEVFIPDLLVESGLELRPQAACPVPQGDGNKGTEGKEEAPNDSSAATS